MKLENICINLDLRMTNALILSILPHRLQGQKVKSQSHGAGAYCGGHLAAQLVIHLFRTVIDVNVLYQHNMIIYFQL